MSQPLQPVFADDSLDRHFLLEGYVRMPMLDPWEVDKLTRLYLGIVPEMPSDFFSTAFLPDSWARRRMAQAVEQLLAPHLSALLPGYTLCSRAFVAKRGGPQQGPLPLHQDYSFVDPAQHHAVHLWIPLVDVSAENGCLTAVPRSHGVAQHLSAFNTNPSPWDAVRGYLDAECTVRFPMKRGEAFFFDQRLLHGSTANQRDGVRIAMVAALLPTGVKQRLYVMEPSAADRLTILEVADEFAIPMRHGYPLQPPYPDGVTVVGSVEYTPRPLSQKALEGLKVRAPEQSRKPPRRGLRAPFLQRLFPRSEVPISQA